jgi:hypothetical protein
MYVVPGISYRRKYFSVRKGGKYGLNPNNRFRAGISMGSQHGPEAAMGIVLLISTLETTKKYIR